MKKLNRLITNFILKFIIDCKFKISARSIWQEYNKEHPERKIGFNKVIKFLKYHLELKYAYGQKYKSYYFKKIFNEEKFTFLKLFYQILKDNFIIIFIDESSFGSRGKKRKKWIKKSTNLPFSKEEIKSFKSFELILACSFEKIIYYEILDVNNDSKTFKKFLINLIKNLEDINLNKKKIYLYLDNSIIHHSEDVLEFIMINRIKVLFGVNNYSLYDFCEYIFQVLKDDHYKNLSRGR